MLHFVLILYRLLLFLKINLIKCLATRNFVSFRRFQQLTNADVSEYRKVVNTIRDGYILYISQPVYSS